MRQMVGQIPVNSLIDELVPMGSVQPELASRGSAHPADPPNPVAASSGMLSDIGGKQLLPALTARTPAPRRPPSGLSVGIFLYLLSVGIVATATVGVFYGIAFFFLAHTTEAMNANATTREHGSDTEPRLSHALSNVSPTYGDRASVPIEPQIPRSAATAALPVASVAPPIARQSIGDVPASDAKDHSFGKRAPDSGAGEASPDTSPPAAQTTEPAPASSVAPPGSSVAPPGLSVTVPASEGAPRLTAIQIAELLARGDSFLHTGDVASARLFYERAAIAGDWQSAMRMGATFDPAFLDRAGVRTVGDPIRAQSWYRHALDLGGPKTDHQVESSQTK